MKLGLHIAATDWEGGPRQLGPKLAEVVQAAEVAGFDRMRPLELMGREVIPTVAEL